MTSLHQLRQRLFELERNIDKWQKIISASPQGRLIARKRRNGKFAYSYRSEDDSGKKEIFIPRSNVDLARKMALRDYAKCRLNAELKEKRLLEHYLKLTTDEKSYDS